MAHTRRLVLGLGNPLLGEDAFGVAVVDALRRGPGLPDGVEAREAGTDLLGEIEGFAAHDEVVLVDAVVGLAGARRVSVIDERAFLPWPDTSPGSHTVSPLLAVKLFRTLNPGARTRFRLVALHAAGLDRQQPLTASVVADGVAALAGVLNERQ